MTSTLAGDRPIYECKEQEEVAELERRLADAKRRLAEKGSNAQDDGARDEQCATAQSAPPQIQPLHFLLLLSDSALPLGSFAFSSGLESYLAHSRSLTNTSSPSALFTAFLPVSVASYVLANLPFTLAAHRDPSTSTLARLDDHLDASIVCTVGRRASIAQGRALLTVWERSLVHATAGVGGEAQSLSQFARLVKGRPWGSSANRQGKHNDDDDDEDEDDGLASSLPAASAHLAPLFGAVAHLLGLTARQAGYVLALSHVKALVSAAVRAGVFGPFQAQRLLASTETQALVSSAVEKAWDVTPENAAQSVPVMDLWLGRHEMLYSRIFNS